MEYEDNTLYVIPEDEDTPTMWGFDSFVLSIEQLHQLLSGNYKLFFSDGEYGHTIYLERHPFIKPMSEHENGEKDYKRR